MTKSFNEDREAAIVNGHSFTGWKTKDFRGFKHFVLSRGILFCQMFLRLNHHTLDIYHASRSLIVQCYILTKGFPVQEKFGLTQQIRRAALSVFLNINEGASRRSEQERKRFYEISRGSLVEIDAAFDIAATLEYCKKEDMHEIGSLLIRCFSMLSKLISK